MKQFTDHRNYTTTILLMSLVIFTIVYCNNRIFG